jgi:hypothetical protein
MDMTKHVRFSSEAIKKLVARGVIDIFEGDLKKCQIEIRRLIREESVLMDNLTEKYENQKWCLINVKEMGLVKIPVAETPAHIVAITVAHPVTDPRCIKKFEEASKGGI